MAVTKPNFQALVIRNEIPNGDLNCDNRSFSTEHPFVEGSLEVILSSFTLDPEDVVINSDQDFTLNITPTDQEKIWVNYIRC